MPRLFRAQPRRSGDRVKRVGAGDYDRRWNRFSRRYRQLHPFCEMCRERDRLVFAVLVDHKYPVADGGAMFPGDAGVWSLCQNCHSSVKAQLENHARNTGQLHRIVEWCDRPETRPRFRGEV